MTISKSTISNSIMSKFRKFARSALPTFSACLGSITIGCILGYTASAIPDLNKQRNAFHLNTQGISLVTSIPCFGSMIGGPIGGIIADCYGRKFTLMMLNLAAALGWLLIAASTNVYWMCTGRFITGICSGIADLAVAVYIAETAHPEMRGLMGSCQTLASNVGILSVYAFSTFLHWNWLAVTCQGISLLMVICMLFMVESPRWLWTNGYKEASQEALQWLRGQEEINKELHEFKEAHKESPTSSHWKELAMPKVYKPLLITITLFFIQQFSGCGIFAAYMVVIVHSTGFNWNPSTQTVIVALAYITGVIISANIVDRIGRKLTLCLSAGIMTVGLVTLAIFFQMQYTITAFDSSHFYWLPIACLCLYGVGSRLGYATIPFYLASELLPSKSRGIANGVVVFSVSFFTFITTIAFPYFIAIIQFHGVFWMFAIIALLGIIFPIVAVPETKGKSLEEIEMSTVY